MSESERELEDREREESQEEDAQGEPEGPEGEEEPRASEGGMGRLTYIQELEGRLRASNETLSKYIAAYKDLEQDKERFKERLEREKKKELEVLRGRLVTDLLELMDNLDRSVMGAQAARNFDALSQGITMVQSQFVEKLGALGVKAIQTIGQPFDPNLHEALDIAATDDPEQDNQVIAEYGRGFKMGERIIRPARVRVGRFSG